MNKKHKIKCKGECGLGFEYEENDIIEFNGEKFVECPCCKNWTELKKEE